MPGDLLRSTPAAMGLVLDSYWTLDDQMRLENSYPDLVKTLGGCPDNEVSGRFKTISILNTATQEGYASEVCDPTMTGEGAVSVEVLLPGSVSAADELTEKVAVSTFEHQVGLFFGRPTTDDERDLAKTASSSCVPKPCSAETYARTVCFALLSSSEMLFY